LRYGYSNLDLFSYALTFLGIGLLAFFWRGRRVDFSAPRDPEGPSFAPPHANPEAMAPPAG
jgi:hypothetical protein